MWLCQRRAVGIVVCVREFVNLELLLYKGVFVFEGCVRLRFSSRRGWPLCISSGAAVSWQMSPIGALPCLCQELCVREDI